MSADLFAAFGTDSSSDQQQSGAGSGEPLPQAASTSAFLQGFPASGAQTTQAQAPQFFSQSTAIPAALPADDDNDDWGEFEGSSTIPAAATSSQQPFALQPVSVTHPTQSSSSAGLVQKDLSSIRPPEVHQTASTGWQSAPIVKAKKSSDPSILFDAEDDADDDDDDFGDFEGINDTTPAMVPARQTSPLVDLMGDLSMSSRQPNTEAEAVKSKIVTTKSLTRTLPKKTPVGGFGKTTRPKQPLTFKEASPPEQEDSWDTFDDWEASIPVKAPANAEPKAKSLSSNSPSLDLPATLDDPQPGETPPTNVPPPGVLLSLFPSVFNDAQEKLFKPMASYPLPMRNKLMAEPATIAFVQAYLVLVNVAARLIAGRKLRWKRDQHLSQGMRIGPASSRATSGMKLTGIDKGENMKEEREVADVVRAWKDQVGRLRHVVSGVNQIKAGTLGTVPDLHEALPVKTLKQSEGGIPARQPCMLCGLKREERVTATDMATDDSFGEWWVDQVNMHRGCRNFWQQHKDELRQR